MLGLALSLALADFEGLIEAEGEADSEALALLDGDAL